MKKKLIYQKPSIVVVNIDTQCVCAGSQNQGFETKSGNSTESLNVNNGDYFNAGGYRSNLWD